MDADHSITNWIGRLADGDDEAAHRLWERYFARLVVLARDHLLPDHVPHLVQSAQPDRTATTERAVRNVAAARPVCSGHLTTLPAATPKSAASHRPYLRSECLPTSKFEHPR